MSTRVLCVAEKNSVAKQISLHLSGGQIQTRNTRIPYIKNYDFQYNFGGSWSNCQVTMTSVAGHTEELDFPEPFRSWGRCELQDLFDAPVVKSIPNDKKSIADNIRTEARRAKMLYIWTDCDREGEYIGTEIRNFARDSNRNLEVLRAKFSNVERAHIIRAARNPSSIDENQANAVSARMEIDLRIGAVFTRLQTLKLQESLGRTREDGIISYGSCQFPTLGFVVDRFKRVQTFVPEPFWSINVFDKREDITVKFNWDRNRLFDRLPAVVLYEKCVEAKTAKITSVQTKPTRKWKPLPLTTIELQKQGSRFLGMNTQSIMKVKSFGPIFEEVQSIPWGHESQAINKGREERKNCCTVNVYSNYKTLTALQAAEALYTSGFISYPRTETDQFDRAFDLRSLIERQQEDQARWGWGPFARSLLQGGFSQPRNGSNNDKAHPPIHPVSYVTSQALPNLDQKKVYEFVVRRFLACCSEDAVGETTNIALEISGESFHTSGLRVIQRNYLDVYKWDRWESSQQLPEYQVSEEFAPSEINLAQGQTAPPHYITEPELVGMMEANGIGTDATIAEHIEKIIVRNYVVEENSGRGTSRVRSFCPSTLGVALVEAYDAIASEMSLSKPFLRKEMEKQMKDICEGRATKEQVVQENLRQFRNVYSTVVREMARFRQVCRRYYLAS